jgi:hypothetical protein
VSKSSFILRLKCAVMLFLRVLEAFGSRVDLETVIALCFSLDLMDDVCLMVVSSLVIKDD